MKNKTIHKWVQNYVPSGEVWTKKVEGGVMVFLWIRVLNRVGLMTYYPELNGKNYEVEPDESNPYDSKNPRVINILDLWGKTGHSMNDEPISIYGAKRAMTAWDKKDEKLVAIWCPIRCYNAYYTIEDEKAMAKAAHLKKHPKRGWSDSWGDGSHYARDIYTNGDHAQLQVAPIFGDRWHWGYTPGFNDPIPASGASPYYATLRGAIDAADAYYRDECKKLAANSMIGHNSRPSAMAA